MLIIEESGEVTKEQLEFLKNWKGLHMTLSEELAALSEEATNHEMFARGEFRDALENAYRSGKLRVVGEDEVVVPRDALSNDVLSKIEDDAIEAANKMPGAFDYDVYYATMRDGIIRAMLAATERAKP